MSLTPGSRFGPYEITAPLGAGGMGEVFRATDTKLKRDVAIKILPPSVAGDHDRLARFRREAEVLASLNHPNIAGIHGLEESGGITALVMELVEGEDLSTLIARGPLPLSDALPIARQIAEALEAAHEQGIIHRDLKPANIKVRPDGMVKVLDFGLAKAMDPAGVSSPSAASLANSPTMTSPAMTAMGMILGTAAYMAPEQAKGRAVDKRADIWAFGVVFYEMLVGTRLFEGETMAETMAAVLKEEPKLERVPQQVRRLLGRCLEKDPHKRLRDISVVWELLDTPGSETGGARADVVSGGKRPFPTLWIALAGVFAVVAAALASIHFRETPPEEPVIRATLTIPDGSSPSFVALSPDGRRLAVAMQIGDKPIQLLLRALDSPQLKPLPNTEAARAPVWSPDGKSIAFTSNGKLKTIPASGGPAQTLCDAHAATGAAWNSSGVILFSNPEGSIARVNASGGECAAVTKAELPGGHQFPAFLPDGKHFFYTTTSGVFLASLDNPVGNGARRVLQDRVGVVYAPRRSGSRYGHLLFLRDTTLLAQPFDERSLQTAGDPFAVAERASTDANGSPEVSVSPDGLLVFVAGRSRQVQLVWLDRSGTQQARVGSVAEQVGTSLSPDGKTVATAHSGNGSPWSLWLHDLVRDSESKLTEPGTAAVWSPDAKRIAYTNSRDLFLRDAAGGSGETALLRNGNPKYASSWSRDGRYLLYTENDAKTGTDIWYLDDPLSKATPVRLPGQNGQTRSQAQLSPDGHWVAYTSGESGRNEVYIRPFPNGPGQWKVSTGAGAQPRWSESGKEIFYAESGTPNRLMAASIHVSGTGGPGGAGGLEIGVPQKLFEFRSLLRASPTNLFSYAVAADGRFLVGVAADNSPPTIEVISNWQKLAAAARTQ